jgi:protein-tyrosine phosphatase
LPPSASSRNTQGVVRICFVCLGNICRSPTAEGVMRHLLKQRGLTHLAEVESAGTAAYHEGEPPDRRSIRFAKARGIVVDGQARQFHRADFARFDYVLALDERNLLDLEHLRPPGTRGHLSLLLAFDPESPAGAGVPDPYYGGNVGFEHVLDLCQRACHGLIEHLLERQQKGG